MRPILENLLIRQDSPTPRLNRMVERGDLEGLEFREGRTPDIDLNRVDELPVRTAGIIDQLFGPDINIQSGVAETEETQGWYKVSFPENFANIPIVNASTAHRDGEFNTREMEPPSHRSPSIDFDANRIDFENTFESNFKETSRDIGERMFDNGQDAFESFLPTVATVDLSDPFVDAWDFLMEQTWGHGRVDKDRDGAVESVFGALGAFLGRQINQAINEKSGEIEEVAQDAVPDGLSSFNTPIQNSYRDLSTQSQVALNDSQKMLYDTMGMPEGALMTPVNIRNVTRDSFEVLGMEGGMEIQWIAVG